VAQHQSQCSIFAYQKLKVSNIFICSCCFRPTATWPSFRCWATLINPDHQPVYRLLSLSKASNPFLEILQQLLGIKNQVSAMSRYELYLRIRYFTHNQSYRPNCDEDYYLGPITILSVWLCWRKYKNNDVTTCCSITLIIKSTSCSVGKFVLEVCVSVKLTYVK